ARHEGGRRFPRLFDQFLADQVAKGFGAVGVSAPADQFIELLQKDAVDGDANPAQTAHAFIIVTPTGRSTDPGTDLPVHAAQKARLGTGRSVPGGTNNPFV